MWNYCHLVEKMGDCWCRVRWGKDLQIWTLVIPHAKNWLIGKDPDAGRDWGQEEQGMTEDGMAGWHHRLEGHEFGWTLGVGDGQEGLACCDSWGHKELDMTKRLNWTELEYYCFPLVVSCFLDFQCSLKFYVSVFTFEVAVTSSSLYWLISGEK